MRKSVSIATFVLFATLAFGGPVDSEIESILDEYFKIQASLAQDSTKGVDAAGSAIVHHVHQINASDPEVGTLLSELQSAAQQIQGKDLEAARSLFFDLSKPLLVYLNKFYSGEKANFRFFCSMAKKGWIQPDKATKNPYYGSSMLTCGTLIQ